MKAFLHIGIEKTGSTFLQDVCHRKTATLARNGTLYPRAFFKFRQHLGLAVAFNRYSVDQNMFRVMGVSSEDERRSYMSTALSALKDIARKPYKAALFTSEHLSLLDENGVAELAAAMHGVFSEVNIGVFLRRQDDLALSAYSESVRSGGTGAFNLPKLPRYNFASLLEPWEKHFGCAQLSVFSFTGKTFREDFFSWAGSPELAFEDSSSHHASMDADEIELLRQFYRLFPRFTGSDTEALRLALLKAIDGRQKGAKMALSEAQIAEIKRRYSDINALVSGRYMGGKTIFP